MDDLRFTRAEAREVAAGIAAVAMLEAMLARGLVPAHLVELARGIVAKANEASGEQRAAIFDEAA